MPTLHTVIIIIIIIITLSITKLVTLSLLHHEYIPLLRVCMSNRCFFTQCSLWEYHHCLYSINGDVTIVMIHRI